jgi:hypothetical protein
VISNIQQSLAVLSKTSDEGDANCSDSAIIVKLTEKESTMDILTHIKLLCVLGVFLGVSAYAMQEDSTALAPPPELATLQPPPAEATEAQRLSSFATANEPTQLLITFVRPLQENQIDAILRKASAEPFRVYMYLEGLAGTHAVPPSEASLTVLANARSISFSQTQEIDAAYRAQLNGVGKLADADASDKTVELARDILRKTEQNDLMLKAFKTGIPITYAVSVVSGADSITGLRSSPNVKSVEIGFRLENGRAIVPVPQLPEGRKTWRESPRTAALSKGQILQEARGRGTAQ